MRFSMLLAVVTTTCSPQLGAETTDDATERLAASVTATDTGVAEVTADAVVAAPQTLGLTIVGPVFMGGLIDVRVTGIPAGASVGLASSTQSPVSNATCPPQASSCLDLVDPTLYGSLPGEGGTAVFQVPLPYDDPAPRFWFQAVVLKPGNPAESPTESVLPQPYRTDSDGDRALDANELWLGLDRFDPDSDNDGVVDGRDLWPRDPSRARANRFKQTDVIVSDPNGSLIDPEFEVDSGRMVWATRQGEEVWLANINLSTGALVPIDGKGTLIDRNIAPLDVAENGPEWAERTGGSDIVYAKRNGTGAYYLWRARESGGSWATSLIPGPTRGFGPLGQHERASSVSRISWWRTDPGYRFTRMPWGTTDDGYLGILPNGLTRADSRYTTGLGPVMSTTTRNPRAVNRDYQQIALFNTTTQAMSWATDDPTWKFDATVWRDPRTGDPVAVVGRTDVITGRYTEVAIYRQTSSGWVLQKVLPLPPSHPYVIQPRPITWNGRSYVHYTASQGPDPHYRQIGQIWLASIDADSDVFRRVDDSPFYVKLDSEGVNAGVRPWVFYSESRPGGIRLLRRCELGPLP